MQDEGYRFTARVSATAPIVTQSICLPPHRYIAERDYLILRSCTPTAGKSLLCASEMDGMSALLFELVSRLYRVFLAYITSFLPTYDTCIYFGSRLRKQISNHRHNGRVLETLSPDEAMSLADE